MRDRPEVALAVDLLRPRSVGVVEDDDLILAPRLRGHHRRLRAGQELACVHRVLGAERDTDRERDLAARVGDHLGEPCFQPRRHCNGVRPAACRQDHGELLASHPADHVRRADDRAEHRRDPLQNFVALAVAADVVDPLEVVDVEHHQRERLVRPPGAAELGAQPLVEVAVVVEAGERVGVGEMLEPRPDLRVVEGERGGVAEPAGELELLVVEECVLADAVDVQRPLQRPAGDQRHGDQRLWVGRRSRDELDPRVEVRLVGEHRAAVCDRPAGDPLAVGNRAREHLLLPRPHCVDRAPAAGASRPPRRCAGPGAARARRAPRR